MILTPAQFTTLIAVTSIDRGDTSVPALAELLRAELGPARAIEAARSVLDGERIDCTDGRWFGRDAPDEVTGTVLTTAERMERG